MGYNLPILLVAKEHKGRIVADIRTPLDFNLPKRLENSLKQAYQTIVQYNSKIRATEDSASTSGNVMGDPGTPTLPLETVTSNLGRTGGRRPLAKGHQKTGRRVVENKKPSPLPRKIQEGTEIRTWIGSLKDQTKRTLRGEIVHLLPRG